MVSVDVKHSERRRRLRRAAPCPCGSVTGLFLARFESATGYQLFNSSSLSPSSPSLLTSDRNSGTRLDVGCYNAGCSPRKSKDCQVGQVLTLQRTATSLHAFSLRAKSYMCVCVCGGGGYVCVRMCVLVCVC